MTPSLIQPLFDGPLDIVGDVHGEIDPLRLARKRPSPVLNPNSNEVGNFVAKNDGTPGATLAIGSSLRPIKCSFDNDAPVWSFSLDLRQLQQQFIERVEAASGKPVILQSDPKFAGHATIKIATKEQPAHVLLYKPEEEAVLPYLVAYECEFALRTIQADPSTQFNLVSKPNMHQEVLALMQRHHEGKDSIPSHTVPQVAKKFGNGLGLQLRSIPITMRIDKQLHDACPELTDLQHKSIDRQLQENMHALSPRAKAIAPDEIIRPNASMNAAFAKFFAGLWGAPMVFAPYVAAGYGKAASALLAFHEQIPAESDHDRELVDAWAKYIGLDRWFQTEGR